MGKLVRLGSRKKAKRWPKGQSSNSNPETTKHREQAAWMFFKEPTTGIPGLTKEDLKKHDAIQGIEPQLQSLNIDNDNDQAESTIDGTVRTVDTFASTYSNCTNMSFNRFLSHFQSNSILHKEMLAVLSAVTDVIKQNGGTETSTEYFAALMSTLEAVDTDTSVAATLSLLGMGLRTVPKAVLNAQFGAASKIFLNIMTKYIEAENFLIIRHCISCISILLRAQEAATWSNSSTTQMLDGILSFTIHTKPKIRKSAQRGVCTILKGSDIMKGDNPPAYHPAAPHIAKYCVDQLNATCERGGVTTILHTLTLLKDIINHLPKSYVKSICEGLLTIMGLKNVLITSCCLQTIHGLFVSRPPEPVLPAQRNAQIISALYDYQPPANDAQPTLAWLVVMQEAHCNLAQNSLNICSAIIPRMLEKCIELWLSDKKEVISGASHTIKILFQACIAPLCENEDKIARYSSVLDQIISMMHRAMSYQYLEAWYYVLQLIALLFQIVGKSRNPKLLDIIKSLAELRDSYNFSYNADVEYAIGAAVRAMGPSVVLQILPLMRENNTINLERSWLLPLLKDSITHGSLSFFIDVLLPLAVISENKSKEPVGGKTYEFLTTQIWAILPSLCNDADDVKDNFKNIAKVLGMAIAEKRDLRLSVMASLRKLVAKATEMNKSEDISELARFAKNYLPLLFNLYTTKPNGTDEEGQRLAAFDTIKIYLTITDKEMVNELFDKALNRLNETGLDDFFKESVYDLIRLLVEYANVEKLKKFYELCIPFLKDNSKPKEQKKAYKFLEGVCGSEKEVCKNFVTQHRREIQKLLISTATTLVKTSRWARIRCLMHLVKTHPQLEKTKFLKAIVPEAVLCVKDINERCRTSSYQLLNIIAEKFLSSSEYLTDYTNMLTAGLAGDQKYCSATLLALASITYHYNGSLGVETIKEILGHACSLALSPTREIVESALSYIKVYISVMPSPIVASTLTKIVGILSEMNEDCKRHFRQKVRDIFIKLVRKYGVDVISGMVPVSDTILHKRLKNIHKVEEMKKKNRELKKQKQSDEDKDNEFSFKKKPKSMDDILADSDEEFCETEQDEPKKNKKRTSRKEAWIQETGENIVDLIDPTAARNISTTQPGTTNINTEFPIKKEPKDYGFKTAPDGRIIIAEGKRKDDSDDENVRKKRILADNASDDDYEEDEEDVKSVASANPIERKRKYSQSSDGMSIKSFSSSKYRAGGSGIHRPLKMQKTEKELGSEYRARKAGGDIKKKGKPDPYAYLPLTRAVLNRRKKKKVAGKVRSVISGAKKGAQMGMKNRKKH